MPVQLAAVTHTEKSCTCVNVTRMRIRLEMEQFYKKRHSPVCTCLLFTSALYLQHQTFNLFYTLCQRDVRFKYNQSGCRGISFTNKSTLYNVKQCNRSIVVHNSSLRGGTRHEYLSCSCSGHFATHHLAGRGSGE